MIVFDDLGSMLKEVVMVFARTVVPRRQSSAVVKVEMLSQNCYG
jgi:hypothetical protein